MSKYVARIFASATVTALLIGTSSALAQTAPTLGEAGSFAVLGGSAVSNVGATVVHGDLGVSPGTAITGFPPGLVVDGTIHPTDAVAAAAQADLVIAYNFLAGQAPDANMTGMDLGGQTLNAGVYFFSAEAEITGTLTLDAQGDPDAVFIFQIGSTLTTATDSSVSLVNGASACNVFWQVGSSATLGTSTDFQGSILALTSITLITGTTVEGRLLARNGAVTLGTNVVDASGCPPCPPIIVLPLAVLDGIVGTPYSQTIMASGGTEPYSFEVILGTLPTGITLNATTGLLSGTPTTTGSFTVTVRVTDALGCFGDQIYTFVINAFVCPPIDLTPAIPAVAISGTAYSQTITASGGTEPYTFSVTAGILPAGLTLAPSGAATASISGTPTIPGIYTFTVTAIDANGCLTSQIYILTVNCPPITILPATLPVGTVGVAYDQTITATGGTAPYTYALIGGELPAGLSFSLTTGELTGTPTIAASTTFGVEVTDAYGCVGIVLYTLVVNATVCPPITLTAEVVAEPTLGVSFSQLITASGGTGPYVFSLSFGILPVGMTLTPNDASSVLLSGIPTSPGIYVFTITAIDANGCIGTIIITLLLGDGADVSVVKSASSDRVVVGGTMSFFLDVFNAGPLDAENVVVTDVLHSAFDIVRVIEPAGWDCTQLGQRVTCGTPLLPAGTGARIEVEVRALFARDVIVNTVTVESTTPDVDTENNTDTITVRSHAPSDGSVPTLGEWGVAALALLMGFFLVRQAKLRMGTLSISNL